MITRIAVEQFKSYRTAALPLAPLTLLIGANASGKTNVIEAVRFLSLLARGRRLDDIFQSVQREDVAIRGTVGDLAYGGSGAFALGCSLSDTGEWEHLSIRIGVEQKEMRVLEESIRSDGSTVPLYEIKQEATGFSHEVQVAYNNFARGGKNL